MTAVAALYACLSIYALTELMAAVEGWQDARGFHRGKPGDDAGCDLANRDRFALNAPFHAGGDTRA